MRVLGRYDVRGTGLTGERGIEIDAGAMKAISVPEGPADDSLAALGQRRRVVLSVSSFLVVPEIVAAAIRIAARTIWMQEGVVDERSAELARRAGLFVVMDRCIAKEIYKRRK